VIVPLSHRAEPVPLRLARWAVILYGVLFATLALTGTGSADQRQTASDLAFLPVGALAAGVAWLAARQSLDGATRRAWQRLALAFLLWWAADAVWCWLEVVLNRQPFPSPADVGYLGFYPAMAWGLLSVPGVGRLKTDRTKVLLDAATVLLAAGMVVWYLVVGPLVAGQAVDVATVLNVAYPVGDLLLLFVVAATLLGRRGDQQPLWLLLGGVACIVLADLAYARLSLSDSYAGGDWPDVLWMGGLCLFALAGMAQLRPASAPGLALEPPAALKLAVSKLPYAAVALGYGLLIAVGHDDATYPLNGLLVGAAAITATVVARQMRVMADNERLLGELHHLAEIDGLTAILNRRSFFAAGDRLLRRSQLLGRPLTVLMIDVDHFKAVNDTFGHAAGDAVLAAVAARTKAELRETDVVGRYGGDELAVLMPDCSLEQGFQIAERIRGSVAVAPVTTDDGPVPASLSIGVAQASAEVALAEVFGRADAGLYEAKRAGRGCTRVVQLQG
jgi:diguanylate cyclase (GGDEF)-like protein